jgi:uncharacterized protein
MASIQSWGLQLRASSGFRTGRDTISTEGCNRPMDLLKAASHRPWPLPSGHWIQAQTWSDILFAHWPVPVEALRAVLPDGLELDTFNGTAWVGITPFRLERVRLRGLSALPLVPAFPEVDIRTYVRLDGKPGVFYFSLNAPNPLVVAGARFRYRMPYRRAEVSMQREGEAIRHCMDRKPPQAAGFQVTYRPASEVFRPAPDTLDSWLIERFALFTVDRRQQIRTVEIHRLPWPLQRAEAEIRRNTLAAAHGLSLPDGEPLLHFSTGVDVLIWPPRRAG